jgi:hypothetical protein
MSLQSRLADLIAAAGAAIKADRVRLTSSEARLTSLEAARGRLNVSNATLAAAAAAVTYAATGLTGSLTVSRAGAAVKVDIQVSLGATLPTANQALLLGVSIDGGATVVPIGRWSATGWVANNTIRGSAMFTGLSAGAKTVTLYAAKTGGGNNPSIAGTVQIPAQLIAAEL